MLNESPSLTITTNDQSISMVQSEELITSTPNSLLNQQNHSIIINRKDFQRQALAEHNSIRVLHQKSTLKLNEKLNTSAQVNSFPWKREVNSHLLSLSLCSLGLINVLKQI